MKTTKTSSNQTRNLVLSDGTKVKASDNTKNDIKKGKVTKHVYPKKKFSTETGKGYEDYEIKDDFDTLEYPPPSKHPLFRKFWAESIDNLVRRKNFEPAHLGLLETLCRLRVELRALDDFVAENGHTFRVVTLLGEHRRTYPEINERNKVLTQIATFSKLLDLIPKKDNSVGKVKKEQEDEWA